MRKATSAADRRPGNRTLVTGPQTQTDKRDILEEILRAAGLEEVK